MSAAVELPPDVAAAEKEAKEAREALRGKPQDQQPEAAADQPPTAGDQPEPAAEEPPATDGQQPTMQQDQRDADRQIAELRSELNKRAGEYGGKLQNLQSRLAQMIEQNADLLRQLHEQNAASTAAEARTVVAEDADGAAGKYLSDKERNDLGDELIAQIAKISRAVVEHAVSSLGFQDLPKKVQDMSQRNQLVEFFNAVEALAAGFKDANGIPGIAPAKDQNWLKHLAEAASPLPGLALGAYLERLPQMPGITTEQVIQTYAEAFNAYSKGKTAAPAASARAAQAVPARARGGGQAVPGAKRTYTSAQVEQLSRDAAQNPNKQARDALIAELKAAAIEGRINW